MSPPLLATVALGVVTALLASEVRGGLRVLAYWTAHRALSHVDSNAREHFAAQWTERLDALEGRALTQVLTALRMFRRAAEANGALGHKPGGELKPRSHFELGRKAEDDEDEILALDALDDWIVKMGDNDDDLREQLRKARSKLKHST